MHMYPMDTHTRDREHDNVEEYKAGSSLAALVAIVLVLALLIGAVVVLGGVSGSESNEVPAPTEAPLDPGV